MEDRIRKGNDIGVSWAILADAENQVPYDLTGRRLTMYLTNRYGTSPISGFKTEGHIVKWTYYGKDQKQLGPYTLTLVENEGNEDMHTVDFCKAFVLVARSCEATKGDENKVELVHLDLSSELTIGSGNGGGSSSGGSVNREDFEVRTVYPTKQTVLEEDTFDITEEERAYNIETLSKTLSGKTVFCKVGEAILFPTISMSGVITEATYSTVVVLVGSLASYSLTITSNGDAEVVIADVTTGGGGGGSIDPALLEGYMPMMREFSDDFNDDFAR